MFHFKRPSALAGALTIMLGLAATQALAATPSPNFSTQWASTSLHVAKGLAIPVQGRIFERFIQTPEGSYPVATVTYFKISKASFASAQEAAPSRVAEQMRIAMGLPAWHTRQQKNAQVFEALWQNTNRAVRVYLNEESGYLTLSIAIFRLPYMELTTRESELLQRQLMGVLDHRDPWLEKMVAFLERPTLIRQAEAGNCPPCNTTNPLSALTCATCTQTGLAQDIANQLQPGGPISQIGHGIDTANGQLGTANSNWSSTNGLLDRTSSVVNARWADTNKEISRANDILENALSFEGAFVTAAGVATGGLAVTAVVELVKTGGEALIEAITHAKSDQERLATFERAREEIEKSEPGLRDLEAKINSFMDTANTSLLAGSRRSLIQAIAESRRGARMLSESLSSVHRRALLDGNLPAACTQEMNHEGARLELLIERSDSLLKSLDSENQGTMCQKMSDGVEDLLKAERKLHSARLAVLANVSPWDSAWHRHYQQDVANAATARRAMNEVLEADTAGLRRDREIAFKQLDQDFKDDVARCLKIRSPFWSIFRNIPVIGRLATQGSRGNCEAEVLKPDASGRNSLRAQADSVRRAYNTGLKRANDKYITDSKDPSKIQADPIGDEAAHANFDHWLGTVGAAADKIVHDQRMLALDQKQAEIKFLCERNWESDAELIHRTGSDEAAIELLHPKAAEPAPLPLETLPAPKTQPKAQVTPKNGVRTF